METTFLIPLSSFLQIITRGSNWFRIRGLTKENKTIEIHSSCIHKFYNNIFIEKLLSKNFKTISISINYKFKYSHYSDESKDNDATLEIDLINANDRLYVKTGNMILDNKNRELETDIYNRMSYYKDTKFNFICIERKFEEINKHNNRKPFKLEFDDFRYELCSENKKEIDSGFQNHLFNKADQFELKFNMKFFDKADITKYTIPLKFKNITNIINKIESFTNDINTMFTDTLENRKTIKLITKLIYSNEYELSSKVKCGIRFSNDKETWLLKKSYYSNLLNNFKYFENEYLKDNSDLESFWDLIKACGPRNGESFYKAIARLKDIFPETENIMISRIFKLNNIHSKIVINLCNTNNDLKLLHLFHYDGVEDKLEKLALSI